MNRLTIITLATVFVSSLALAETVIDTAPADTVTPPVAPANTSPAKEPPEIIKGKSQDTVGTDNIQTKIPQKKKHKIPPMSNPVGPPMSSAPWPNAPPPQTGLGGTPPPPTPPAN